MLAWRVWLSKLSLRTKAGARRSVLARSTSPIRQAQLCSPYKLSVQTLRGLASGINGDMLRGHGA